MKLLPKFTLIFLLVFGAGFALAAYASYHFLRQSAREQVLQQARLMMETMTAARVYTTKQIDPLLESEQRREHDFIPETIPFYAATESFNYIRTAYPDYAYKEAALNPTNPRDRAVDWEADIINNFRNQAGRKEFIGERTTPTGPSLFLARPIQVERECLACHDRAASAPPVMVHHYGRDNGFGWKEGEVIGAQIVSVPMAVPVRKADADFRSLMIDLGGIFLAALILLDVLLYVSVVRPVGRLSTMADQISLGNFDTPELPADGRDEISVLAGSFNRMRRSLEKALKILNG